MISWSDWHREPPLVYGLILAGWTYGIVAGPLRQVLARGEPFDAPKAARFYAGLALAYLAVGSPLDQVGSVYLFSAAMVQHMLILYPIPALLLLGLPGWMVDVLLGHGILLRILRLVLNPLTGGLAFILVFGLWHLPRLFEQALQDAGLRAVEQTSLLCVALAFWWPMLSPSRALPAVAPGIQAIYLSLLQVALTALFSYVFMADHAIYPTFQYAPRLVGGLTPLEDQRLAAVILGVASSLVLLGALGSAFFRWARLSEGVPDHR
jgi:putative membrane protein